jgi:hypothetical protein
MAKGLSGNFIVKIIFPAIVAYIRRDTLDNDNGVAPLQKD